MRRQPLNKSFTIRTTEARLAAWSEQALAVDLCVSDWARQRIEGSDVQRTNCRPIRRRPVLAEPRHAVDADLIKAINWAGNNLNQIARWCNIYKVGIDQARMLAQLASIERQLLSITEKQ